jgi:hypothetical protein
MRLIIFINPMGWRLIGPPGRLPVAKSTPTPPSLQIPEKGGNFAPSFYLSAIYTHGIVFGFG